MNTTAPTASHRPLHAIRSLDYTVLFVREMAPMRRFYGEVMGFECNRTLGDTWVEYRVGANILALTQRGMLFDDPPPPKGTLGVQLAFRVAPGEVDQCANALREAGVQLVYEPQDRPFGHRTVFFRDPDGNVLEIYAEI